MWHQIYCAPKRNKSTEERGKKLSLNYYVLYAKKKLWTVRPRIYLYGNPIPSQFQLNTRGALDLSKVAIVQNFSPFLPKSRTKTPVNILLQLYFKQVLCEAVAVPLQVTVPLDQGGHTLGVTLLVVASTAATMRARPSSLKSPMSWCPVWNLLPPSTQLPSNLAQVSEIDDPSISLPTLKASSKPFRFTNLYLSVLFVLGTYW